MSLITIDDFGEYKAISLNINKEKDLQPFIDEAEEFDLKPVIGSQLFIALRANITQSIYQDLLNGKQYTYQSKTYEFKGIKAVLVYYTYCRLLINDGVTSTPSGFVKKTLENSERAPAAQMAQMINQAKSGAKHHEDELLCFLNRNSTTYPLYSCSQQTNTGTVKINAIG